MTAGAKGQAHLKRWITGLAALAVLIACVIAGGAAFSLLAGLGCLACLWEYVRIVSPPGSRRLTQPMALAGYAAGIGVILAAHAGRADMILAVLSLNGVACGLLSLLRFPSDRTVLDGVARQIQGGCYIPLPLALLILLRSAPDGMVWIFLLCAVIFAGDTAALYAGTLWGRHKLCPAISPGKTWEGVAGGLLGVQVYAIICAFLIPALESRLEGGVQWLLYLGGMGLLCAASIVGDLFESAMKRQASVKDSGTLLPGHGGMLDRIDSAVAALPVAALIAYALP